MDDTKIIEFDCLKNCRVCLLTNIEMCSLYGERNIPPYGRLLMECANINIDEQDGLPTVICRDCIQQMLEAHKFVTKCQETDKSLRLLRSMTEIKKDDEAMVETKVKEEIEDSTNYNDLDENVQEDFPDNDDIECFKKKAKGKRKKYNITTKANGFPKACTYCGVVMKFPSKMIVHMRKHTNQKPYQCTDCGACYRSKNSVERHYDRHHRPPEQRKIIRKVLVCEYCKKTFLDKNNLIMHVRTHTGETPYRCTVCPKAFNQLHCLKRHILTHTGEKPFQCEICKKCFATAVDMTKHRKLHSDERNYACSSCDKTFKSRVSLKTHSLIHTDLKSFVCDKCGMSFKQKTALKSHCKKVHSGEH